MNNYDFMSIFVEGLNSLQVIVALIGFAFNKIWSNGFAAAKRISSFRFFAVY